MLNKIYKKLILCLMFVICVSFADSARVYLSSETEKLISNCSNNVDIMIDTQWEDIFWASINMIYDRKNIQIDWFYLNDAFNLPLDIEVHEYKDFANIKSATLSLIRNDNFQQIWFSGLVKFATIVLKNKEPIESTRIEFLFSGYWVSTDNMDVFRLWDAKDVLKTVEMKKFNFEQWNCLHNSPDGVNQLDQNYDFQMHLNKNLKNIANLEKMYPYKKIFLQYWSYILIFILIIVLFIIMYKKWIFKNNKNLKNNEEKND